VPRTSGVGGMVSFQHRLAVGLKSKGIEIGYDLGEGDYQAVLVTGGTRQLASLYRVRKKGIPVIQRLDGMNWLHRLNGIRRVGLRHFLRSEYGNWFLSIIRGHLASHLVYQSEFVRKWWERVRGLTACPSSVIWNGVDLHEFSPQGPENPPTDRWQILIVEGSLMGGYEQGITIAVRLIEEIGRFMSNDFAKLLELKIVGRVPSKIQERWNAYMEGKKGNPRLSLSWTGVVSSQKIPAINRSAHVLYSADINPACPNSVIEALACGLPVVAFDTGALSELVTSDVGLVVPYGGDPWKMEIPDIAALARASIEILNQKSDFRKAARARAEAVFAVEKMVQSYLEVLL